MLTACVELRQIVSAYVPRRTKRYSDGIPIRSAENVDCGKTLAEGSLKVANCSNAFGIKRRDEHASLNYDVRVSFGF